MTPFGYDLRLHQTMVCLLYGINAQGAKAPVLPLLLAAFGLSEEASNG